MTERVLISCHVPKTGGTSFRALLERCYGDRVVFLAGMESAEPIRSGAYPLLRQQHWYARVLDSHDLRCVSADEWWPGARFAIILRDPVERFLSYYFFRRHHCGQALRRGDPVETEQWLERHFPPMESLLEPFADYQTRFVAAGSFFVPPDEAMLERAMVELERYDYIGFSEITDRFPAVLASDFPELSNGAMPRENQTPGAGAAWSTRVDPSLLDLVRAHHERDARLYDAAIAINRRRGHPVP